MVCALSIKIFAYYVVFYIKFNYFVFLKVYVKMANNNVCTEAWIFMTEKRDITIKDVAYQANVSVSTVSRVLNGLDRVSPTTRDKVMDAVHALGYVQNNLAASMITGQTHIILIMVPDFINEFYASVVQGAEQYLNEHGYMAMVCSTGDIQHADLSVATNQFGKIIDGAIVIPADSDMPALQALGKPVVLVDRYTSNLSFPSVVVDDRRGTFLLTEELLRNGHEKIAIISGKKDLNVCQERLGGYYDALDFYGKTIHPEYICLESMYEETGYRYTNHLLSLPTPPTAIVAGNNLICIGCIRALIDRKKRIGTDISLVGFDDHILAAYMNPGITVVSRPTLQMGEAAADVLMRCLRGDKSAPTEVKMEVELVRRDSVLHLR